MRDFRSVIKELKLYMAKDKESKVFDKDVAQALNIPQAKFATIKKRNSTPYPNIIQFCKKENLPCSKLFFD